MNDTSRVAGLLRTWIQERQTGGCKVLSLGVKCECPLCLVDKLKDEVIEECAKVCDEAAEKRAEAAKEALQHGNILLGHTQLTAAYCAAAIRELQYSTDSPALPPNASQRQD